MIIEKTKHFCDNCNKEHDAQILKEGKDVYFSYTCKEKAKSVKISNDYEVFMHLRSFYKKTKFERYNSKMFTVVELTNKCNYNCPICFASANEITAKDFAINELNDYLDKLNTRFIFLSGGEPTILSNLNRIIQEIKKKKLKIFMFTNGYNLGKNKSLAKSLKKAGLFGVGIQFDTLNSKTHLKIRGNNDIEIKKKAIDNCIECGLSTGLISTIVKENLKQIGDILNYIKLKQPFINLVQFQPAKVTGRFNYHKKQIVYRDEIINEIIHSSIFEEVSLESFLPYPKFRPMNTNVHPDCGAFLMLFKYKDRYIPLNKLSNTKKLYSYLGSNDMRSNIFTKNVVPLFYLFKSTPFKNYLKLSSSIFGTIFRSKKNRILFITASTYGNKDYQDTNRLKNCSNQVITGKRELKNPCQGW